MVVVPRDLTELHGLDALINGTERPGRRGRGAGRGRRRHRLRAARGMRGGAAAPHVRRRARDPARPRGPRFQLPRPRTAGPSARDPGVDRGGSPSRRPGTTCGSRPIPTATSSRRASTRAVASSTGITRRTAAPARHAQVPACRRLRRGAAAPAQAGGRGPATARPAAGEGRRRGRRPPRRDVAAGRQRAIRAREPLLRADDPARPPRRRPGASRCGCGSRASRAAGRRRPPRPPPRLGRPALPGPARTAALPVRGRRDRRRGRRSCRTTSTTTSRP